MFYGYENTITILLFVISLIIVIYASSNVNKTFKKYNKKPLIKKISGFEVAKKILEKNNLSNIYIIETNGELTDHYDPRRKVVRLSSSVFHGETIAAAAIAAHEVGHAIQDKENYTYMKIRSAMAPTVNLVSKAGYFIMFIAIITNPMSNYLYYGILAIFATFLFQIVTLPVEFDASKKALNELVETGILYDEEKSQIKKVLSAAALTYVASVISALLQMLRLIIASRNR